MAYEFDGEKYRQASSHQKQWGLAILDELQTAGSEQVLDLGCGDGRLTAALAARVPEGRVLGIDASASMIDAAQRHVAANLSFRQLDINDMDFDEEFDLVFSNATLHWVKDHARLLGNVRRALRPGGAARVNFGGDGNCSHLIAAVREVMARDEFAPLFADFTWPWFMPTLDEYRRLVAAQGFAEARVWSENADRHFATVDEMVAWIDQPSLVPFVAGLAGEEKRAFRDAVVERMITATRQNDGRCFETFRRINLMARK